MRISDWSSDVCSSDLVGGGAQVLRHEAQGEAGGELAGEHLLLQLVLGAVVAAGGGVQHVDDDEWVEPEVGADDDRFGGSGEPGRRDVDVQRLPGVAGGGDRKGTRLNSSH